MELILNRFCFQPEGDGIKSGTFGRLEIDGEIQGYTVEQPWADNKPFESCVPDGKYKLIPFESPKYGDCFVMVAPGLGVYAYKQDRLDDKDRYLCLFVHKGNYPWNFHGCVGLGEKLMTDQYGQMIVTSTTKSCKKLLGSLPREEHDLIIYSSGGCI